MSSIYSRLEKLVVDHKRNREGLERQLGKTTQRLRRQEELRAEYFSLMNRNLNLIHEFAYSQPCVVEACSIYDSLQNENMFAAKHFELHGENLKDEERSLKRKMDDEDDRYHFEYRRIQESRDD